MSDRPLGTDWWQDGDGRWFPPDPPPRRSPWDSPPPSPPIGPADDAGPPVWATTSASTWGSSAPAAPAAPAAPSAPSAPPAASAPTAPRTGRPHRSVRGPRFTGGGLLGLFGLLGLLVTLGLMAVLAVRVLSDVGGDRSASRVATTSTILATTVPPGGAPSGPVAPGAAPVDQAVAASCATDRATVETAVEAYRVVRGSPPPDMQSLVAAGLLTGPVDTFALQAGGTDVSLVGQGACAGR